MGQKELCVTAIEAKVRSAAAEYGMLPRGSRVLVAFSGGADSTALLSVLARLSDELGITVGAFHLEHGIRGEESLGDERHCRLFCAERGIPYHAEHVSVPTVAAERGGGIEETAREIRYERLSEYCRAHGYDRIATAHHADDNIETVIFRLARGTGIRGLCGIPPIRMIGDIAVVRPLIECDRELIEAYLGENSIGYVTDSTNDDEAYSRNRIRHSVIPELKKINPSLSSAVSRLCRQASMTEEATDAASDLPADVFGDSYPELLLRRQLADGFRDFVREEGLSSDAAMLEAVHIDAMVRLWRDGELWGRVSLPQGVTAVKERGGIVFRSDFRNEDEDENENAPIGLHTGWNILPRSDAFYISEVGAEPFSEDLVQNTIIKKAGINIYKLSIHISVNYAKLNGDVSVRKRADGDRIRCAGMTKRVKKLLSAAKLSPAEREALPILTDGDGIVWIPGIALRDGMCCKECESSVEIHYFSREAMETLFGKDKQSM